MSEALRFWALAEGLGLLATPLAGFFLARLPGRGLALARPLGLLLVAYPAWLLASLHLLPYGDATIILGIVLLGLASTAAFIHRRRTKPEQQEPKPPSYLSLWLTGEVVFTVCFFSWAVLRAYAPDVWGTEKPMDMAFINAINRSQWFPPHDPWLSGTTINYYYFGHLIVAYLLRLTAVEPSVGFNLGVCLMYALSATAVYGVASAMFAAAVDKERAPRISPILPGLAAAALAMLLANLDGALEIVTKPGPLAAFDWWSPSRVIANTINEFPFFSYLLADLHAHMMAAPFGLLALAFAVQLALWGPRVGVVLRKDVAADGARVSDNGSVGAVAASRVERASVLATNPGNLVVGAEGAPWARARPSSVANNPRIWVRTKGGHGEPPLHGGDATIGAKHPPLPAAEPALPPPLSLSAALPLAAELLLAALVVGSLYVFNGWDYPTQLGIGLCCLYLWASAHRPHIKLGPIVSWAAIWVAASFLLFLPFYLHFKAPTGGIGVVTTHSTLTQFLHDYLLIYGLPVWLLVPAFAFRLRTVAIPGRFLVWGAIAGAVLLVLLAPSHLDGPAILLALLCFALLTALDERLAGPARLFWLLLAIAIGLVSIGEFVYVRDVFDHGPDYRMNTIFKFGYQAWFLLAILAGCALFWSRGWLRRPSRFWWGLGLAVLVAAALVYPVAGSYAREGAFTGQRTLDGLQWLARTSPGDVAAIRWLQTHVQGAPTVLESVGQEYDPVGHARVSTFTGLPTVLGWAGHEAQWDHDVGNRAEDVKTIYTTTDLATARRLLAAYNVRYVFVGSLERADFPAAGLAKFGQLGTPIFSDEGTIVYEIPAGQ